MCSCGGVQNTRISSIIIASASFSEQSRELPTVSVDVNCTHMFLRVRITKKWQEGFGRRLARWLRLAHQTRGGEHRLGLTGALDEGMRCWLKRGFGGRSIVESMPCKKCPKRAELRQSDELRPLCVCAVMRRFG